MRLIAIFCLVSLIDSAIAFSQVADKPIPPSKPARASVSPQATEQESMRVIHLRHTNSASAIEMLMKIGPKNCLIVDDERLNALFVRASEDDHKKIEQLLEVIDAPETTRDTTEILHSNSKNNIEAGGAIISKVAKMYNVEVAFDDGLFVVKGPKEEIGRAHV